ncbi:MAG: 3-coathanger stack domain-containing protein, partial [Bacteroidota bacterium]
MTNYLKIAFFVGCFLAQLPLFAQPINSALQTPSAPSVAATNFGKQAEINTNFYTGAAGYSLGLCAVSDATVSHAVSLVYNSSNRVSELASSVGLGWHLAGGGGLITRQILSLEDDDSSKGFYHQGNSLTNTHFDDVADADRDGESDIYTVSAGPMTLKFIFDNNQVVHTLPQSDVKITPVLDTDQSFRGFKLQSPTDGMVYYFGYHPVSGADAREYTDVNDIRQLSSWMLTRIESFDGFHFVNFEYEAHQYRFFSLPYCTKTGYRDNGTTKFSSLECGDGYGAFVDNKIDGWIIKRIVGRTKTVTFDYFTRLDLWPDAINQPKGINKITVEDGGFCYRYDLTQDYFEDPNTAQVTPTERRLRLTQMQKRACYGGLSEPPYTFEYHGYTNPNGSPFYPNLLDKNRDHWDFYNYHYDQTVPAPVDNNDYADLIPNTIKVTPNGTVHAASLVNRESYHNAQLIGALKKVTLPSRGSVEIAYESNTAFKYDPTPIPVFDITSCFCQCGGIQSSERTILVDAQVIETGSFELCINPTLDVPECSGYSTTNNYAMMKVYNSVGQLHSIVSFDSPTQDCITGGLKDLDNSVVGGLQAGESYRFVVESKNASADLYVSYLSGGSNITVGGLRVKQTTTYAGQTDTNGNEDHTNDIISTYEYKDSLDPTRSSGLLFNQPQYGFLLNDYSVLFTSSSLLPLSGFAGYHIGYTSTVIKHNGNGETRYTFFTEDTTKIYERYPIRPDPIRLEAGAMKNQRTLHQNGTVEASTDIVRYDQDGYTMVSGYTFKAQRIPTFNGSSLVNQVHGTQYVPRTGTFRNGQVITTKDGVSSTTAYTYHPTILAPKTITTTNSDGKQTVVEMKYTVDHPSLLMRSNFELTNRVAIPYETITRVDGQQLDGTRTSFAYFDVNGKNPDEIFLLGGLVRPYKTWRFERTWRNGTLQGGSWNIQEYFDTYTINGLLETWRKPGWSPEIYTYQNRLLTSKNFRGFVKNYEYFLNSSLLKKITDVDGTSVSATYDDLWRTRTVTDDCKNIVSTFDYHFSTGGTDKNYVKTTIDYPTPNADSQLDILETIAYKDGLWRTEATVQKGQGPDSPNDDIISAVEFDKWGRPFKQYEPQLLTNNNGAFQRPQNSWKYTLTTFYASPQNRPHTVTGPDWHPTTYEYGHNTAADGVTIDSTSTPYAEGELFKVTKIDANGNKTITFTDKIGRPILKRRTNGAELSAVNYDTKTIFDDKNRKVYTLPPNTTIADKDLLFFCEYDREDRKRKEYVPGKALMEYFYNDQDLLIAQRDGYIRAHPDHRYYVFRYDSLGREVQSGFYNSNLLYPDFGHLPTTPLIETTYGTAPHEKDKVKTAKTKILDDNNNWLESTNHYNLCGQLINQTGNNHVNLTPTAESTVIGYDGADNPITTTYNHNAFGNSFTITTTETLDYAGRARESRFQANGSPLYTLNSKFYDEKEQLIRKLQGGTGLSNPAQAWLQQYDYTYLENGLLHKINTANITGSQRPLLDCPVALPNPALPVIGNLDNQDLFYLELAYDVPFNGTSATSQKNGNVTGIKWQVRGREKQGYSLHYDLYNRMTNADYFDENGSGTVTESGIYDVALTYDQRGNIQTLSRYGLTPTKDCYEPALIDQLDYEYRDSNQLALVKDAAPCPDSTYLTPTIDNSQLHAADTKIEADNLINSSVNVTYHAGEEIVLTPGFRVPAGMRFTAQIGPCPQSGFETGGYSQRNLDTTRYDVNGNLALDPQKAISTTYNHLDLPEQILLADGKSINFTYDASGTLLTKVLRDVQNNPIETRDYIGGTEYVN